MLAVAVVAVSAAAYIVTVFHRTSLSAVSGSAAQRFDIGATQIAVFTVIQVVAYLFLQAPGGRMVDRFGPRAVLFFGLAVSSVGQALFGMGSDFSWALFARCVVGVGDAVVFVCIADFLSRLLSERSAGLAIQFIGSAGVIGNMLSATPLVLSVRAFGWTPTFVVSAVASGVIALLVLFLPRIETVDEGTGRGASSAWRYASTWAGFLLHLAAQTAPGALGLLWGVPFFSDYLGLDLVLAASMVFVTSGTVLIAGPVLGLLIRRHGVSLLLPAFSTFGGVVVFVVVLLVGDAAPVLAAVCISVVIGLLGPVSMTALQLARRGVPGSLAGEVTGIANTGGYVGTTISVLIIGTGVQAGGDPQGFAFGILGMCGLMVAAALLGLLVLRLSGRQSAAGSAEG